MSARMDLPRFRPKGWTIPAIVPLLLAAYLLPSTADPTPATTAPSETAASVGTSAPMGALAPKAPDHLDFTPPIARRIPKVDSLHGDRRLDNYYWLREKESADVLSYLRAENAYADSMMKHTQALQTALYDEMLARIKETDQEVPYRKGDYWYYTRTEQGLQYPIYCRKAGSLEAQEQIVLDVNKLAEGQAYMDVGVYRVSDDGSLLAYSTDNTGFRQYQLQVRNLETGEVSPVLGEKTGTCVWAADNRTIFYTVENEAKRHYRVYRHVLGSDRHDLIFEEPDESFGVYLYRTRSQRFLMIIVESHTTSEWRALSAEDPMGEWRVLEPRQKEVQYSVDHRGDDFYITVNDTGRTFRLVRAPVESPGKANWVELVPVRAEVMLEGTDCFARYYIRHERTAGLPYLQVVEYGTGDSYPIELPEPTYSVWSGTNAEFDTDLFRFVYTSMVTPMSTYDYDMKNRTASLLKRQEVLGGFDPANYRSERIQIAAPDSVRIPVSLVYRVGTREAGPAPLVLDGYGAYGEPMDVYFSSSRLSLLDRGFILALAHVRGGGELGKPWHDAGRMMQKMNTFTDFIAVAEGLIAKSYTSRDRLVITGGSAGGLLVGAVLNLRPDLFRAAVLEVPFVDLLNTMSDPTLPLTVGEFEEWGNPEIKEQYDYMRRYCPYTNLGPRDYPTILVMTSLNDSQVMYWESAKYVAKLRAVKTDANPLLLQINMGAGHGGASGRYDFLKEVAFKFAFVLHELGIRS